MKYRKKPTVVHAAQVRSGEPLPSGVQQDNDGLFVMTLEGRYAVKTGDWVVTGVAGERWPMSDEKFAILYDRLDDHHAQSRPQVREAVKVPNAFTVHCSGGDLTGKAGDYLVLATADDAYPVAADVFASTYEPV